MKLLLVSLWKRKNLGNEMLNFSELEIDKTQEIKHPESKVPLPRMKVVPLDFSAIVKKEHDEEDPTVWSREELSEFSKIEPGHKIPIANYPIVGCWCEHCKDVKMHANNVEKKKLRCLTCKKDKIYGR
jgi:hypothetical protein